MTVLSSRRASIALLAGSLLDVSVVTSTWRRNPLSSETGPRALAPFREHRCETCKGSGKGKDRFRREVVCAACDGAGRLAFDAYTGERVGTVETPTVVRFRSAVCDRCGGSGVQPGSKGERCPSCDGEGRREWSPFELHMPDEEERVGAEEGGLLARPRHLAALYAAGSYAELERALAELRVCDTQAQRVWWGRYGLETVVRGADADLDRAWMFIEDRMPTRVRVPPAIREGQRHYEAWLSSHRNGKTDQRAMAVRDDRMLRMREAGTSLPELAVAFKLTESAIYKALDRARQRKEAA